MERRRLGLTGVVAVFMPLAVVSIQAQQLPKTVSVSIVETDAMPHKLRYVSSIQIFEAEGQSAQVTTRVDGGARVVMTNGSLTASTPDKSTTKRDTFCRLELTFASDGNMVEFRLTK